MTVRVLEGDCRDVLKTLPDESVHCVVTSPPYWGLRDYGVAGQIGMEDTPDEFVASLALVFSEVRRVLRDDGTVWLNLGDSYCTTAPGTKMVGNSATSTLTRHERLNAQDAERAKNIRPMTPPGLKPKDLVGIPWRVAFALQAAGWYLRQDIIWAKKNCMPESVQDRCTKIHEYVFLLAKSERYYYDHEAIKEPIAPNTVNDRPNDGKRIDRDYPGAQDKGNGRLGSEDLRNKRSVWFVANIGVSGAHFATFPPDLIEPCVLAGCPEGGTVLDPFGGSGTTGLVADRHKRDAILIELNPEYAEMARKRIYNDAPLFAEVQ